MENSCYINVTYIYKDNVTVYFKLHKKCDNKGITAIANKIETNIKIRIRCENILKFFWIYINNIGSPIIKIQFRILPFKLLLINLNEFKVAIIQYKNFFLQTKYFLFVYLFHEQLIIGFSSKKRLVMEFEIV